MRSAPGHYPAPLGLRKSSIVSSDVPGLLCSDLGCRISPLWGSCNSRHNMGWHLVSAMDVGAMGRWEYCRGRAEKKARKSSIVSSDVPGLAVLSWAVGSSTPLGLMQFSSQLCFGRISAAILFRRSIGGTIGVGGIGVVRQAESKATDTETWRTSPLICGWIAIGLCRWRAWPSGWQSGWRRCSA